MLCGKSLARITSQGKTSGLPLFIFFARRGMDGSRQWRSLSPGFPSCPEPPESSSPQTTHSAPAYYSLVVHHQRLNRSNERLLELVRRQGRSPASCRFPLPASRFPLPDRDHWSCRFTLSFLPVVHNRRRSSLSSPAVHLPGDSLRRCALLCRHLGPHDYYSPSLPRRKYLQ